MNEVVYTSSQQGQVLRVFAELRRSRGLLADLVSKELRGRYRNAMMGLLWAVLQPLLMTLILTFVFTVLFSSGGRGEIVQSALQILSKLIFWQFLATALLLATQSPIDNQELIKKVHFPRETIPLATVCNCLVNLGIGFVVLIVVHFILEGPIQAGIIWVPLLFAIQLTMVVGLALLLSAANVFSRDVTHILEIVLTFGFYASPVLYPLEFAKKGLGVIHEMVGFGDPGVWSKLYMLNPMAGLLEAYQQAIVGGWLDEPGLLIWPTIFAAGSLAVGVYVFRRSAPVFADHL